MSFLAIDPGIRGCGVAVFADSRLVGAAYVASPIMRGALDVAACVAAARAVVQFCGPWAPPPQGFAQIVCEWPQVYTPGKQKGDPNDLPPLVGVDCAICAHYPNAQYVTYLPAQWKGQMIKEATKQRVEARLSTDERLRVWLPGAVHLQHNVFDALGIGLHHAGRFERHRAIAR